MQRTFTILNKKKNTKMKLHEPKHCIINDFQVSTQSNITHGKHFADIMPAQTQLQHNFSSKFKTEQPLRLLKYSNAKIAAINSL
jgi:hypothetical protein